VGLNATRNYTVRYGSQGLLWSVGRVQTPVLAMIVGRDDEIRTFKPKPFWELVTHYRNVTFKYLPGRFLEEIDAGSQLESVQGHPFTITKVDRKEERSKPPRLYDLTELQRDMNRRFDLSADATLKAAQALYEAKLITYPRTDSRYLTNDMKKQIPGIFRKLQSYRREEIDRLSLNALPFSRLIATFYPPCQKEVTSVDGTANRVPLRARGVRVVDPGWTELYPRGDKDERDDQEDDQQSLPAFTPGESGPHEPKIKQGETSPPRHFTENTLLGAMETAGKLVDDDELKEALKSKGLGTPATRAAIIETLLKRRYITRDKKSLLATDLGRYLVAIVRDADLKSPELTGQWEAKLRDIAVPSPEQQAGKIKQKRVGSTRPPKRSAGGGEKDLAAASPTTLGNCPLCGAEVREQPKSYSCSGWKQGCKFVIWKTTAGKRISGPMAKALLTKGKTRQLKGFKSKAGKPFEARLKLVDGKVELDFSS